MFTPRTEADLIPADPRWVNAYELGFRPAAGTVAEINPPRFSWPYRPQTGIGASPAPARQFVFQIADNSGFTSPTANILTDRNFYNSLAPLPAGTWYWRVGYDNDKNGTADEWSATRHFIVEANTPTWNRSATTTAAAALAALPRPRLGPTGGDWLAFRTSLQAEPRTSAWLTQLQAAADAIVAQNWFSNPASYFPATDDDAADGTLDWKVTFSTPAGTEAWSPSTFGARAHDIATVAFAHKVTGNAAYAGAKAMMQRIAAFPSGDRTLSWPEYNGSNAKQSVPIAEFLALVYDWYFSELNATERSTLRSAVRFRVEKTLYNGRSWRSGGAGSLSGDAYYNGVGVWGDSHPYQNFMWTLPAALLIAGDDAAHDAYGSVPLLLDFLNGVTSSATYGHDDGGVNEGAGYGGEKQGAMLRAALMTRLLLPSLQVEKNPYFAGYQRFYSHLIPTDYGRIPFGDAWSYHLDDNALVENMRLLTLLTGDGRAKTRWEALVADSNKDQIELGGFTRPWTVLLAEKRLGFNVTPVAESKAAVFPETGFVFAGSQPPTTRAHAQNGVRLNFQSRPRGAQSHSYNAENSFAWYAFGQTLAAGGGGRTFGDPYAKSSMSHNVLLVDGKGQGWTDTGAPSVPYMGRLLAYTEGPWYVHWVGDATNAYRENGVPLKRWHRHVVLVENSYFVVFDDVELDADAAPATLSWLMQADMATSMNVGGNEFSWTQSNVNARVVFAAEANSLSIVRRTGNDIFNNLITGVGSLASVEAKYLTQGNLAARPTYNDAYPPEQRTASQMWVSTAEKQKRWQLMSALLAWTGGTAPSVTTLSDRAMRITSGAATRTVSFDPNTPGDLNIDLNTYRLHAGETIAATPSVSVTFARPTVSEGETAILQFVRTEQYDSPVTVQFSLSGTASYGLDFASSEVGSVTIPAGASVVEVPVYLHNDTALEADESLIVDLAPSSAFAINAGQATLTIADNDTIDTFSAAETVGETSTAVVPVVIRNPAATAQTITLSTLSPSTLTEGYVWNTSTRQTAYAEAPEFEWVEITSLPNAQINTFTNTLNAATTIPMGLGFSFPFFTTSHSTIHATTSGYAMFSNGLFDLSWNPQPLPYNGTGLAKGELSIMPFWNFLQMQTDSTFYYAQVDANTFAMQWDNIGFTAANASRRMTFQVLLRKDGRITFNYRDYNPPGNNELYTIGLQNHDRNKAIEVSFAPEWASGGRGLIMPRGNDLNYSMRFWRQPSFLALGSSSFSLQPGESRTVNLTLSTGTTLGGDTYHSTVRIQGSASGTLREIPVALTIAPASELQTPQRLSAAVGGASQINLTWDDVAGGETGFELQRATSPGGPFTAVTTAIAANAQSYNDSGATNTAATRHYYRLRALGAGGSSSAWSGIAAAGGIGPAVPTGLSATAVSEQRVDLAWSPGEADYFIVQRSVGGGAFADIAYTKESRFSDLLFVADRNYSYRIVAVNGAGSSAATSPQAVTLPPAQDAGIITHPASVTITSGQSTTLTVQATGTSLAYQWYRGVSGNTAQPIAGATAATYATGPLTDDARYWVRVTGVTGASADSTTALVRVDALLAYEGFSHYPAGTDVRSINGGTGWSGNWATATGTIPSWLASATGLSYTSVGGDQLATADRSLYVAPSTFGTIQRGFTIPPAQSGADLWFSVLVNRTDTVDPNFSDGFQFALVDNSGNIRLLIDGKKTTTLMHVTRTPIGSAAIADATTIPSHGLRLIVGRVTSPGGTADSQVTLWADPNPLYDIASQTPTYQSPGGLNLPDLNKVRLGLYGGRKGFFDEIRVGFNAGSVAPIPPSAPLSILTTSLPTATVGIPYAASLAAAGGTGAYTWTHHGGDALPAGLSLSSNGMLSGTPAPHASYRSQFTVRVADSTSTDERSLTIIVPDAANLSPQQWRDREGLSGVSATQDTDGDGLVDLLEYAFGGNAKARDSVPRPSVASSPVPATLRFSYRRRIGQESRYLVQTSADLMSWQSAVPMTVTSVPLGDGFEQVTATLPLTDGKCFVRLAVVD